MRWAYKHPHDLWEEKCVHCPVCDAWQDFVLGKSNGMKQYEVWNADYIARLAEYILERATALALLRVVVVEVGAGDGRLSHFLRRAIDLLRPCDGVVLDIIATDSGARRLPTICAVEAEDHVIALGTHQPQIVLCSWMELGEDWTRAFRDCISVNEYVLIGEIDDGCCGHPSDTWGYMPGSDDTPAPHDADGFVRVELGLSQYQVCKTDEPWGFRRGRSWSHSVSFRRVQVEANENSSDMTLPNATRVLLRNDCSKHQADETELDDHNGHVKRLKLESTEASEDGSY